jgi:Dolichyl-phosphate-mannose-protein mannosyltransferase
VKKTFDGQWRPLVLIGVALLGFALRLYGLNWDDGNSFHPDERQILFHVTTLGWPKSFAQFLDPANSPLNPHFFAYGSFPLYLLALLGHILAHFFPAISDFANLTLVGRVLSALFDSGTILITGCLALFLADDFTPTRRYAWSFAFLSAALVAFTPFQLQLSHFYAVDSVLLFFVALTLLACVALVDTDAPLRWSLVAGLGFGLAMATKFSAAPLIVSLFVAVLLRWYRYDLISALSSFLLSIAITGLVFLIAMPYALLDFSNFVQQVAQQGSLARGTLVLPYTEQFAGTTPYVYEMQNMVLWGLGLMPGLAAFAGLLWLLWRFWKREASPWLVVLSWVIVYFAITGSFYVKFMRYMLPIYPFLTLMAAAILLAFARYISTKTGSGEKNFAKRLIAFLPYVAIAIVLGGTMFQGLALLNVYSQPNTRIQASLWMYSHIKPGSVLTYEQWDDPLPFPVDGHDPGVYQQAVYLDANKQPQTGLDLYGDDTVEKAQMLANLLPTVDVITMATDRLDKSIPRLPARYPLTIHYYQLLFSGKLGFHLAAQFENHPNLFGITLDDSSADESYSVFDHPHVRIFVRENPYPYTSTQLFQLLLQGVQLPPPSA